MHEKITAKIPTTIIAVILFIFSLILIINENLLAPPHVSIFLHILSPNINSLTQVLQKICRFCWQHILMFYLFIQNTAYKGTDLMLFSNPKFLVDILMLYLGLYFLMYSFRLLLLVLLPLFTSTGIISPSIFIKKSIS